MAPIRAAVPSRLGTSASHLVRAHFVLTAVPLYTPLFTVVLVHGWYIFLRRDRPADSDASGVT